MGRSSLPMILAGVTASSPGRCVVASRIITRVGSKRITGIDRLDGGPCRRKHPGSALAAPRLQLANAARNTCLCLIKVAASFRLCML